MRALAGCRSPSRPARRARRSGTTRRVAIPLLEHLDGRGWTRRLDGSLREVVRRERGSRVSVRPLPPPEREALTVPQKVRGVVARVEGRAVSVQTGRRPRPRPGERRRRRAGVRGLPHRPALPRGAGSTTRSRSCSGHEAAGLGRDRRRGRHERRPGRPGGPQLARRLRPVPARPAAAAARGTAFDTHNATQPKTARDGTPLSPALGIGAFAEQDAGARRPVHEGPTAGATRGAG
jgi:hypothetical protein